MNKLANKLTVAALCLTSLVGLSACSCDCTRKKTETTTTTTETPAAPAEDVSTSIDAQGVAVEQVAAAEQTAVAEQQPVEAPAQK